MTTEAPTKMADRRITNYSAQCRDCQFTTGKPRDARAHGTANHHTLSEIRHYLIEPA
jgi:hypothetical protein